MRNGVLKVGVLACDLFSDGSFECRNVDVTGEMNRALSVDGIPSRGICRAEILCLKADAMHGFLDWQPLHPLSCFPSCPARGTPDHLDAGDLTPSGLHFKLWRTE
jgi:hypothetical protein